MHHIKTNSQQFTIQQLSKKLEIPKPTLRFWEEEFKGLITPLRTPGGQRRYTEEHISIIKNIKNFRDMGKSILEIKEILTRNHYQKADVKNTDIEVLSERISQIVLEEVSKFLGKKSI